MPPSVPGVFGLEYRPMSEIDATCIVDDRLVLPDFSGFFHFAAQRARQEAAGTGIAVLDIVRAVSLGASALLPRTPMPATDFRPVWTLHCLREEERASSWLVRTLGRTTQRGRLRRRGDEDELPDLESVRILDMSICLQDALDEAAVLEAKERAERALADRQSDIDEAQARAELIQAVAQLRMIRRLRDKFK